jgi:sRNA-binding regulator protein Hfq
MPTVAKAGSKQINALAPPYLAKLPKIYRYSVKIYLVRGGKLKADAIGF